MTPSIAESWRRARLSAKLRGAQPRGQLRVAMGDGVLTCEISLTPSDQTLGLAGREALPRDSGMIFISPLSVKSFWMRGTKIPLDIAFFKGGRITRIVEMTPFSEEPVSSLEPVNGAIEAGRGWFKERRVKVGDEVSSLGPPPKKAPT